MTPTNKHEEWEKRFDEKFEMYFGNMTNHEPVEIKSFIRSLLATQKKELWDMCEEMMKPEKAIGEHKSQTELMLICRVNAHNSALSAAQEKLRPPTVE